MELTKIRHITIYICEISKLDAAFIEVICSFKLWGEILEKNWGNFCESYVIVKPSGCSCNRFAICIIEKKFTTHDPRVPSDTLTVTYSMTGDIGKCVGKMADVNIPENVKK